jgi:hypothetical protein
VFVFIAGGTALSLYLFYLTKSILILVLGVFAFYFYPLIFQRNFRKKFSQDVLITFSEEGFIVEFDNYDKSNMLKADIIKLDNVKLFKTSVDYNNDFSSLKIVCKDGRKVSYTFSGQKNDNVTKTDINFAFKEIVESYNRIKGLEERIKLMPSFYATRTALYLGLTVTIAMAAVILYFGFKKPKTLVVSIGFLGLYLQMVSLRKRAIKDKNRFN